MRRWSAGCLLAPLLVAAPLLPLGAGRPPTAFELVAALEARARRLAPVHLRYEALPEELRPVHVWSVWHTGASLVAVHRPPDRRPLTFRLDRRDLWLDDGRELWRYDQETFGLPVFYDLATQPMSALPPLLVRTLAPAQALDTRALRPPERARRAGVDCWVLRLDAAAWRRGWEALVARFRPEPLAIPLEDILYVRVADGAPVALDLTLGVPPPASDRIRIRQEVTRWVDSPAGALPAEIAAIWERVEFEDSRPGHVSTRRLRFRLATDPAQPLHWPRGPLPIPPPTPPLRGDLARGLPCESPAFLAQRLAREPGDLHARYQLTWQHLERLCSSPSGASDREFLAAWAELARRAPRSRRPAELRIQHHVLRQELEQAFAVVREAWASGVPALDGLRELAAELSREEEHDRARRVLEWAVSAAQALGAPCFQERLALYRAYRACGLTADAARLVPDLLADPDGVFADDVDQLVDKILAAPSPGDPSSMARALAGKMERARDPSGASWLALAALQVAAGDAAAARSSLRKAQAWIERAGPERREWADLRGPSWLDLPSRAAAGVRWPSRLKIRGRTRVMVSGGWWERAAFHARLFQLLDRAGDGEAACRIGVEAMRDPALDRSGRQHLLDRLLPFLAGKPEGAREPHLVRLAGLVPLQHLRQAAPMQPMQSLVEGPGRLPSRPSRLIEALARAAAGPGSEAEKRRCAYFRAMLLYRVGEDREAARALQSVMGERGASRDAIADLLVAMVARSLEERDPVQPWEEQPRGERLRAEAAGEVLDWLARGRPTDPHLDYYRGVLLSRTGRRDPALACFDSAAAKYLDATARLDRQSVTPWEGLNVQFLHQFQQMGEQERAERFFRLEFPRLLNYVEQGEFLRAYHPTALARQDARALVEAVRRLFLEVEGRAESQVRWVTGFAHRAGYEPRPASADIERWTWLLRDAARRADDATGEAVALLLLADTLKVAGQAGEARRCLLQAWRLAPSSPVPWMVLRNQALEIEDLAVAEAATGQALLRLPPDEESAGEFMTVRERLELWLHWHWHRAALRARDPGRSLALAASYEARISSLRLSSETTGRYLEMIVDQYEEAREFSRAAGALERLLRRHSSYHGNVHQTIRLSRLLAAAGRKQEAIDACQRLLNRDGLGRFDRELLARRLLELQGPRDPDGREEKK